MPLAGPLTAVAARLLPVAERARYCEEFGSELAEIALAGGRRRTQLAYAARTVLSSAWQLRAELRSPGRRGDRPVTNRDCGGRQVQPVDEVGECQALGPGG
jgi:hypothetical protein